MTTVPAEDCHGVAERAGSCPGSPIWAYRPCMEMRTRPVDEERCPACGSCVLELYGTVEMAGPPFRVERIFGQMCGNPDCRWQKLR